MILELCDYFYDEKDMSFFLEDENMPVNELIYERMTSRLDARIAKSFDEYFSYAYAVCAKLNTDKYPEAHFKSEYWDELPSGNAFHRLVILAIVYVTIAFQKTLRLQYPKMMRAIFDWELEGKLAPQSHNVLRIFLPVMKRCLKERKRNFFTDIPGESMVNKFDNFLIRAYENEFDTDFTVGKPKSKKDAENMMKQMQDTLLETMFYLEKEEEEQRSKKETAQAPASSGAATEKSQKATVANQNAQTPPPPPPLERSKNVSRNELIILVGSLLGVWTLSDYTNQTAFARIASILSGFPVESLQPEINKIGQQSRDKQFKPGVKTAAVKILSMLRALIPDSQPEVTRLKIEAMIKHIRSEFELEEKKNEEGHK